MILRRRDLATDARTAALDVFATARALAASGSRPARLLIDQPDDAADPLRPEAVAAWSAGIGVVTVGSDVAREAALTTAAAIGASVVEPSSIAADDPRAGLDGRQAAARHALGLEPDETVELVLGRSAPAVLATRLQAFDERCAADPDRRRRLIFDGRPGRGARISAELIAAIVHPLVLVDLQGPDAEPMRLARIAADDVVEAGQAGPARAGTG